MQTNNSIEIPLSIDVVCQLYTCHEQLPDWSPGFISLDLMEGNRGDVGSIYEQRYRFQEIGFSSSIGTRENQQSTWYVQAEIFVVSKIS